MGLLRAGRLRHEVVIEQPTTARDGYGDPVPTWATYKTRRAAVRTLKTQERLAADQPEGEADHEITIRYTDGVTSQMRINWADKGRLFLIVGPPRADDHTQAREMVIPCREVFT